MARVFALDTEEHRIAQELLPWFINETLGVDEAARVAEHLELCSRCQTDAAMQVGLRALAVDVEPAGSIDDDWIALRARIDAKRAPARHPGTARSWWRPGLHLAIGVQALVILVLAILLVDVSLPRAEPYRALGTNSGSMEANALIVFRADASEKDIREALRAAGARIVGGPTVSDAYLLHLGDSRPEALAGLRAHPTVVRAESLQGTTPR